MLIAYRAVERAVFLYGFAKSERENISEDELPTLREIGAAWIVADANRIHGARPSRPPCASEARALLLRAMA